MEQFIIEIHPLKDEFDPLAKKVAKDLHAWGEPLDRVDTHTQRLYRIEGELSLKEMTTVAETLLVDHVVEKANIYSVSDKKGAKIQSKKNEGFLVDVWPKHGVTDPVGETVEKGLRDLGINKSIRATSGLRYQFPKINDEASVREFSRKNLANELIHDIVIRKIS